MISVNFEDPITKQITYPYIGVWDEEDSSDYCVMLFTEQGAGVILDIDDYSNNKVGDYVTGVVEHEYRLYEGIITLKNI